MRNGPHIGWDAVAYDEWDDALPESTGSPVLRFVLLFAVLLCPVSAIAIRLTQLQASLSERYVLAWDVTTTGQEMLPCRDGRILSADGQVLAQDRLRFDILVHYRWLEEPPDDGWLKQRTLAQLTRRERRDAKKVEAARQAVLNERNQLWNLLATTTGRSWSELDNERADIQRRIERMIENVTERRDARLAEIKAAPDSSAAVKRLTSFEATPDDLRQIREVIVDELTNPPDRSRPEPIVVAEELSHHVVIEDVDLRLVAEIESAPSLFPGVRIQASSERVYPTKDLAAHIVGARTELTPEELTSADPHSINDESLQEGDRIGRTGIERAFDQTLRGRRGLLKIVADRRGEILSQSIVKPPVHGRDVVLTIDAQMQRAAERLLDEAIGPLDAADADGTQPARPKRGPNGGCIVALDVRTGDVITAAAAPRFDLGLMLHPEPEQWKQAVDDPRRPFFPRITQMTIPPGSVFKILTSVALLESKLIDPDAPVFCQGYLDRPDRNRCYIYRHYGVGHGDMTLSDAICQSCNVYFFHAARSLGPQPIADWAARFGLGMPTGGEVPGERGGHLPKADASGKIVDEQWYNGSTLQFAIGQASLTVTPLQVARMVAAVANDGYLVTPRFVMDDVPESPTSSNSAIQLAGYSGPSGESSALQKIPGLSPGTLSRIREGMKLVVDHRQGTGKRVRMDDVAIAGKSGTAEVGSRQGDHAWFVGFVPADRPRYAFVVVIEHGGSGGSVAGPIAKKFIEVMLDAGLLARNPPATADAS